MQSLGGHGRSPWEILGTLATLRSCFLHSFVSDGFVAVFLSNIEHERRDKCLGKLGTLSTNWNYFAPGSLKRPTLKPHLRGLSVSSHGSASITTSRQEVAPTHRSPIYSPWAIHKNKTNQLSDSLLIAHPAAALFIYASPTLIPFLEGNTFEQIFTGKEVFEDVKLYTDWRPEIISMYKRLAHEAS